MGETVPARGQSVEGKLLYLLLCFAVSLQLLLNRKIVLGKKKKSQSHRGPRFHIGPSGGLDLALLFPKW